MAKPGTLEKPPVRLALIRELATQAATQPELAEKYGVTQQSISDFAKRHQLRIEAVRQDVNNEFAGIAYAELKNRIEMLDGLVTYVNELLEDPERQAKLSIGTAEMVSAARSAAHEIAEQLGQLPARAVKHDGSVKVNYVIEGVDPDAYA